MRRLLIGTAIAFLAIFTAALVSAPAATAAAITIEGTGTLSFISGSASPPAITTVLGATISLTQVFNGAPPYNNYTGTLTYTLPLSHETTDRNLGYQGG